eukprot:SAG31_NODE_3743_length_3930_cov_6.026103_1_plen_54_part_00
MTTYSSVFLKNAHTHTCTVLVGPAPAAGAAAAAAAGSCARSMPALHGRVRCVR